jgi:hypothetical protein
LIFKSFSQTGFQTGLAATAAATNSATKPPSDAWCGNFCYQRRLTQCNLTISNFKSSNGFQTGLAAAAATKQLYKATPAETPGVEISA